MVYACGAARDGAAAWVLAEMVDRFFRLADACGGAGDVPTKDGRSKGGEDGGDGTPCPANPNTSSKPKPNPHPNTGTLCPLT